MRAVFISYRREDVEGHAGRLFQDLATHFGKDAIFMDVAGIEPGRDFRKVIDQQVASCGVLLALIGKSWLDSKNEAGLRRLEDPADFVRLETAAALKRDIPLIPVLVHGGKMPRAEDLPEDLKDLAYRNAVELTHARWQSDVQLLIEALRPYVDAQPEHAGVTNVALPERTRREPEAGSNAAASRAYASAGAPPTAAAQSTGFPLRALLLVVVAVVVAGGGGYALYGRFAAERAAVEKAYEQARTAKADAETARAASDKLIADRIAADKAAADKAAAAKAAEKMAADRASVEKAAAQRASADKAAAERAAQAAAEKVAADKAAATQVAADRAAATDGIDSYQARAARGAAQQAAVEQALQRAGAKAHSVNLIGLDPPANSVLANKQPVKVAFSYATTEPGGVRIIVTPLIGTAFAPNNATGVPALLPPGNSTGQETFTITSGSVKVDGINIRMIAQPQGQLLYNVIVPALYEFRGSSDGPTAAQVRMKLCHDQAGNLTGDERKRFLSNCLRQKNE